MTRELFPGGSRPVGKKSKPKPGFQEHEILMRVHLDELRLHSFFDYRFHNRRQWKFDFAVPTHMLAIEIEGGAWTGGAHVRGKTYYDNCDKYNTAQILGWDVLRFSVEQVKNGQAKAVVARWLKRGDVLSPQT